MNCRFCQHHLSHQLIDLFNAPPSNSYLTDNQLNEPEVYYPLKVYVCEQCWLVQIREHKKATEIFDTNYAYHSSISTSWLKHAENYVNMISKKLNLKSNSYVIEIASNDGYLLQYFRQREIPCLGIEPTAGTAKIAQNKGINTRIDFFSKELAVDLAKDKKADLVLGNNVLAHVPDINDFIKGLKLVLTDDGTITLEFPHLLNLLELNQFDTIYHEHFSYFSLICLEKIFEFHTLKIYDVEEISTHGGSLRIYVKHTENERIEISDNIQYIRQKEITFGLQSLETFSGFNDEVVRIKLDLINFLITQKKSGAKIIAYGAAAKGNTLLNFCGIKNDFIDFVVDAAPSKQHKYLPGSHIPILPESSIKDHKPDYVIILPWNIQEEITNQLAYVREWRAQFVVVIPKLKVF